MEILSRIIPDLRWTPSVFISLMSKFGEIPVKYIYRLNVVEYLAAVSGPQAD